MTRIAQHLLASLLLASMAGAETLVMLLPATPSDAGSATQSALWIDVPFVRQPKEGCGAASLSMVMLYWQHQLGVHPAADSDVTQIQKQLYEPRLHGIPAEAMQLYLRQHGYNAFTLRGTWNDLQRQLQKGRPLIAALKPQGQSELHYVVIDGVDSEKGLVSMNDPAERKLLT